MTVRIHLIRGFVADVIRLAREKSLSWHEGKAAMRAARYAMKEMDEYGRVTEPRLNQIVEGAAALEKKAAAEMGGRG